MTDVPASDNASNNSGPVYGLLGVVWDRACPLHVTDWTVTPYGRDPAAGLAEEPARLRPGDLVRVFKSVSDGDAVWSGAVDLQGGHQVACGYWVHGMQAGTDPLRWMQMFFANLPARLERGDGRVIFGALEPYFETGTEGVLWAVHEYGQQGYDGLHILQDGDNMTIYGAVRDGDVAWEGPLDFQPVPPPAQQDGLQMTMDSAPSGVAAAQWLSMALHNQPAIVARTGPLP